MSASREVKCKEYRLLIYTIGGTEFISVRDGRNETMVVGIPKHIVANERVPGDVKDCVAGLLRERSPRAMEVERRSNQ